MSTPGTQKSGLIRALFSSLFGKPEKRQSFRNRVRGVVRNRNLGSPRAELLETRALLTVNIGAVRPDLAFANDLLAHYLDNQVLTSGDASPEITFHYGFSATSDNGSGPQGFNDFALAGDFSKTGFDNSIVVRPFAGALQWLGDTDRDSTQEHFFRFGLSDMTPLIADMNGDRVDDVIVVDRSTGSGLNEWYIHYGSNSGTNYPTNDMTVSVDATFSFGLNSDIPQVGDMNGDGRADVLAVRDDGSLLDWYIHHVSGSYPNNTATVLSVSTTINNYGANNDIPVIGDWDNDGDENIGVVDENTSPSTWNLDTNGGGSAEISKQYGLAGDQYIVGNWADVLWDGSQDGDGDGTNWTNANNWSGGAVPLSTQSVVINQPVGATTVAVASGINSVGTLVSRQTININGGSLRVFTGGTSQAAVTVNSGATLRLDGALNASGLTINSGGTLQVGASNVFGTTPVVAQHTSEIVAIGGSRSLGGSLSIFGQVTFNSAENLTLTGTIGGTGDLYKDGIGTLTIATAAGHTGQTTISAGTLVVSGSVTSTANVVVAGGNLTIAASNPLSSGLIRLVNGQVTASGGVRTVGNNLRLEGAFGLSEQLVFTGNLELSGGTHTITMSGASPQTTFSGVISGANGLTKAGPGTLILAGANTYTGMTTVSSGGLKVNGSLAGPVSLSGSATLSGAGTISGEVATSSGTTIAPGNSPGILNTGNFNLAAGSTLQMEVSGLGANPGTDYDQVNVTGTVSLAGTLDAVRWADFSAGQSYIIVNNDGVDAVSGTFSGLPEGAAVQIGSNNFFTISYVGGTGNDVVLTSTSGLRQVGSTADSGAGSLRQAITDANSSAGTDIITFSIPGAGPHVITPATALPGISTNVVIDATSQSGYAGTPLIQLDGNGAIGEGFLITGASGNAEISGFSITGFTQRGITVALGASATVRENYIGLAPDGVTADGNGVSGLTVEAGIWLQTGSLVLEDNVISGNTADAGVFLSGATSAIVRRNRIGTNAAGTAARANTRGIYVDTVGAGTVTIGGSNPGDGNIISGNTQAGIQLSVFTNGVTIAGNIIGLNSAGTAAIANSDGIIVEGGSGHVIGTDADGVNDTNERNVISGNTNLGIQFTSSNTSGSVIAGNYIGTDASGTTAIANLIGVRIEGGSTNNTIGGTTTAARNVISGNSSTGITITDVGTTGNVVIGNYIGTDSTGTADVGNGSVGIAINEASDNTIGGTTAGARNVISGNQDYGVSISGVGGSNTVLGNYVGLNAAGTAAIANHVGIQVSATAVNTIGGVAAGSRNVISGNTNYGLALIADAQVIQGNWIGLNAGGTAAVSNGLAGILINGNDDNVIGGTAAGAGNVISGNDDNANGIWITNGADGNIIQGNFIGTNPAGDASIGNSYGISIDAGATNTLVGGATGSARNIISGNTDYGVQLAGLGTTGNLITGNYIGTNDSGSAAIANNRGVLIQGSASGNFVGTNGDGVNDSTEGNVISGNTGSFGFGVQISDADSNVVAGNLIGLNASGSAAIPNTEGVFVHFGSVGNRIGTDSNSSSDTEERNIIGGNVAKGVRIEGTGTSLTVVSGNYIGTNASGTAAIGNQQGVSIAQGAHDNTIGGTATGARNIISGNANYGVYILDSGTQNNTVAGNYVGTNAAGTSAVGNQVGIVLTNSATNNTIGGTAAGSRNVVSGNTGIAGIYLTGSGTSNNTVAGNFVGTDATGLLDLGNAADGVSLSDAPNNTIGGTTAAARNIISGNNLHGVKILGTSATGNTVSGNYVGLGVDGSTVVANTSNGIYTVFNSNTTIGGSLAGAGNVVSGNGASGIALDTGNGSTVSGNLVGVTADGTVARLNSGAGISAAYMTNTTIGGTTANARNVVVSNIVGIGVGPDSSGSTILGNYVGTDATGTTGLANGGFGVQVYFTTNITVGGSTAAARNIIMNGDGSYGVFLQSSTDIRIQGNSIGVNVAGNSTVASSRGVLLADSSGTIGTNGDGTNDATEGNVIAGGAINVDLQGTSGAIVAGNRIGTNAGGTAILGSSNLGIRDESTGGNRIGSNSDGVSDVLERNIIAGATIAGIYVTAPNTVIAGNYIGTDVTGTAPLGNASGVQIAGSNITVGGSTVAARNVISGNNGPGIVSSGAGTGIVIQGNYFGVSASGTDVLRNYSVGLNAIDVLGRGTIGGLTTVPGTGAGNLFGGMVQLTAASTVLGNTFGLQSDGNSILGTAGPVGPFSYASSSGILDEAGSTIGGTTAGSRNVFGGYGVANFNGPSYVDLFGGSATVQGNYFGTDVTGQLDRNAGTFRSIQVRFAPGNIVGGSTPAARNVFVGAGFETYETNNVFEGNYVGLAADGVTALGNAGLGAFIRANDNTVRGNVIAGMMQGIVLQESTTGTVVTGNRIGTDATGTLARPNQIGIYVLTSGNRIGGQSPADRNIISGNTEDGIRITSTNQLPGTVSYWQAENNANDSAGGNHGTLQGGAVVAAGGVDGRGQAFRFDGNGDYVQISNAGNLNPATAMSISAWFTATPTGNYQALVNKFNHLGGAGDDSYSLSITPAGQIRWQIETAPGNDNIMDITPDSNIFDGQFHHVAVTYDDSSQKLWIDGILMGTRAATGAILSSPTDLFLGAFLQAGTPSGFLNGKLDDVAILNRALTDTEVATIVSIRAGALARNVVQGNYIGTNVSGTSALANGQSGIRISNSPGNLIGGTEVGARNIISGNTGNGITLNGNSNQIVGNYIGVNVTGDSEVRPGTIS